MSRFPSIRIALAATANLMSFMTRIFLVELSLARMDGYLVTSDIVASYWDRKGVNV